MRLSFRTFKGLILTAALGVSIALFVGIYFGVSKSYQHSVKENAVELSQTLAEGTFNAMFQIMRRGWTRAQLEEFLQSLGKGAESHEISILRGEQVSALFGPIEQPPFDKAVSETFTTAQKFSSIADSSVRFLYPLVARSECLRCHTNAEVGDVLGVIQVRQELGPMLEKAEGDLLQTLLAIMPLPFLVALLVAVMVGRKFNTSMVLLDDYIDNVNKVSDLTSLEIKGKDLGFDEFRNIFSNIEILAYKLRNVAVDKELLEFEIRLLEKFVITSDVVRDWREYIGILLQEIHGVIDAYVLFAIFKVDDELFDLDIFWYAPPSAGAREAMERAVRNKLKESKQFHELGVEVKHNIINADAPEVDMDREAVELQTKSLLLDTPKIGGIVGIGVHSESFRDRMRLLVLDSILSTLLNVVGSVKAIYKYTKDMEYYATRDPLTNLYNQRIFWELLQYEIERAGRHNYPFSLFVIDLDNFKSINDTYGHSFGDKFLLCFADNLQQSLRSGDVIARYGGDEFVVILPETDAAATSEVARKLLESTAAISLSAPDGTEVRATISIGTAMYPEHADEAKDLFLFADNMMYRAKSGGKNQVSLPSSEDVVEVFRSIGEKTIAIANAIDRGDVVPYFQPILDVSRGEIAAVEVLSRLNINGEIMGAHEFIEIAEKQGLIHQVDYLMMEHAFRAAAEGGFSGYIFINFSPRSLLIGEFIHEAVRLSRRYQVSPKQVVFEITERDTVKNMDTLVDFAIELKNAGFLLAIDDFGSGFSSFHYLKRLPIDILKIEGDFVANMARDNRDHAFVTSMTSLAHKLGIRTVAEYVEDEEVLQQVIEAGIDFAQGFHIAPPLRQLDDLKLPVRPYN